ncbi:MAG: META domain-containing protein [Bacteroidota bacterium]
MKKQYVILTLLAFALVLPGCKRFFKSSSTDITATVWQWTAMQETAPASQSVVPDPQNYTITFKTDGTATIKADCNNVDAKYKANKKGKMTIKLGASTLMACGPNSQDTIYLDSLSKVESYAIVSGQLQLAFPNGGGKMDFKNGGAAQ